MKYEWIFFDADETLFSFNAFEGLQKMFADHNLTFSKEDFLAYEKVNKPLWVKYQNAEITAEQIQTIRFEPWEKRLGKPASEINQDYMNSLSDLCHPLEGVVETINQLEQKAKLAIITNGFTALQQLRLNKTGLAEHFQFITISQEVGIAKPDARIFEYSLKRAHIQNKSNVIMVGDNLHSDILGGHNAGIDTCWISYNKTNDTEIKPTYSINKFTELLKIL
ncbi:pyrimidine 5'-nucleotidase [Mannheimia massilioguelmaensis]|uniref:pyrimidine 5'-nucleotidase n=1 Tax=Mannheimia massilioguelmaensis TaxID=1604354 RepID=UPI0005C94D56|nr:pyrimidine 5'-nucleotidase [Mannheimia massilioguelmaensis]